MVGTAHIAFAFAILAGTAQASTQGNVEDRLMGDLMSRFTWSNVRPVEDPQEYLEVKMGLMLMAIRNVDEEKQEMELVTWENYEWKNYYLTWNASEYGGVTSVRIPPEYMYMPDVVPYNSLEAPVRPVTSNAVVYADGIVSYVPPFNRKVDFSVDENGDIVTFLKFGSWTYDGSKLNLKSRSDEVGLEMYKEDKYYALVDTSAKRSVLVYDCCPEPYIDVTFKMRFKRKGKKDD